MRRAWIFYWQPCECHKRSKIYLLLQKNFSLLDTNPANIITSWGEIVVYTSRRLHKGRQSFFKKKFWVYQVVLNFFLILGAAKRITRYNLMTLIVIKFDMAALVSYQVSSALTAPIKLQTLSLQQSLIPFSSHQCSLMTITTKFRVPSHYSRILFWKPACTILHY